jgi:hypothetical protein
MCCATSQGYNSIKGETCQELMRYRYFYCAREHVNNDRDVDRAGLAQHFTQVRSASQRRLRL